ncbi:pyridoxamine 5'-phosphate oxidase [Aquimarina celericrescens]|uniref:Pyridoxamine 5'-phosphate oxidase n=1 Tax=Aquimarina celericrescens TaxID=1964542 RepID=A0ABW5AZX7_9FLAO|nr:pyridoxamine 5'-phosphate oxidase [Aquimarina celericrescens]
MSSSKDHNPVEHFQKWFHEVETAHPEDEANAMQLSTIGLDGFPKSRIVLLKRFTWEGFIFFTNYNSEKGMAITKNNKVSISFNWIASKREVSIMGKAEKIPNNLSEGYFESRPKGSKLSAWASNQSAIIPSRKILEDRLEDFKNKFKNKSIPKPEYWGGYIVKPFIMKFIEHEALMGFNKVITYKLQPNYEWSKNITFILK